MTIVAKNIIQEFTHSGKVTRVLNDITLSIEKPSITALMGPSGSGKTTLMRLFGGVRIEGVVSPTSGEVLLEGKHCHSADKGTITVFQRYTNRPDMTVLENVMFPLQFKQWNGLFANKTDAQKYAMSLLAEVGLTEKASNFPQQLSGGQNQRVALARALMTKPTRLLMDEPFGALDPKTRQEMQILLKKLQKQHGIFVVFVTHDVDEAMSIGDRIVVLSKAPAVIAQDLDLTGLKALPNWKFTQDADLIRETLISALF